LKPHLARHRPLALAALLALGLLNIAPLSQTQEWTRFRGPNGSGLSTATPLPTQWTAADYNWRIKLPGAGHASPVLWGQHVYVTAADPAGGQLELLAIQATNGAVAWTRAFPQVRYSTHRNNSLASATPAVDAAHVYLPRQDGRNYYLTALDHAGRQVWELPLGTATTEHGSGHSPVVHRDLVILAVDHDTTGRILAVDTTTGALRWEVPRRPGRSDYSTPCLFPLSGGAEALVFNTQEDGIAAVDALQGRVLWQVDGVLDKRSVSSPIAAGGLIFSSCGSGGGGNYVVALRPDPIGSQPPEVAYQIRRAAPYVPSPLALGDLLFLWSDSGIVTCAKLASGELVWQERVGGNYFSSPVCANGHLYGTSNTGEVVVLAAAPQFQLLGRSSLGEATHATPAIAGGHLYFRTLTHLASLGGK